MSRSHSIVYMTDLYVNPSPTPTCLIVIVKAGSVKSIFYNLFVFFWQQTIVQKLLFSVCGREINECETNIHLNSSMTKYILSLIDGTQVKNYSYYSIRVNNCRTA